MDSRVDRRGVRNLARTVLAADCACPEAAFDNEGVVVTLAAERSGRRKFPIPSRQLLIVTMGAGVVASCHPSRIEWLRAILGGRERDEIFAAPCIAALASAVAQDHQVLRGPNLKLLCSPDVFRPGAAPSGVRLEVVEGTGVTGLYDYPGFPDALAYRLNQAMPDVVAVVARRDGEVVGITAASADSDAMWQIGVNVVPHARGVGIGRAIVGRLTEAVFHAGRVPYYATSMSNLRSIALATSLGYWPAWTDLYVRDLTQPFPDDAHSTARPDSGA